MNYNLGFDNALESFISAIESKGFYWLENPIEKPKYYDKILTKNCLIWQEAEEKTFKNPLIFVKKSIMIQPQELRIGDYIEYNGEAIKLDGSLLCCYIQNELEFPFNPIPLTEEILLKFGFFKKLGNYELENFRFHISQPMNFDGFVFCEEYSVITDKIQFVHQLQNLFYSISGKELIFKN